MIDKEDVEEVFGQVKETMEDMETSINQLLGNQPREYETLWEKDKDGKTVLSRSEDTDEEILLDIEENEADIKDGLQALWVAVNSFVKEKEKG